MPSNSEFVDLYTPEFGATLPPAHNSKQTLELLLQRRSVVAKNMAEPGPSDEEITTLLTIAARVPDHGKLAPWRFILFQGDRRLDFGELLRARWLALHPDASEEILSIEKNRFVRAPLIVGVVSTVLENHKIPEWEQQLCAGAACQNMLIAANALGYAGQWITEWYAYDGEIASALGLVASERIAGFIYIGTAQEAPQERKRPSLEDRVSTW